MTEPTKPTAAPATSPSLADQPAVAPGAIPVGGTDTQEQALDVTREQKEIDKAPGTAGQVAPANKKVYDATLQDGGRLQAVLTPQGIVVTIHDINGKLRLRSGGNFDTPLEDDNGTLAKIVDKFNGVPMTEIEIPRAGALGTAPANADHTPKPIGTASAQADNTARPLTRPFEIDDKGRCKGMGLHVEQGVPTTRLKMTLQGLSDIPGDADNPLTRCTFGAVYSPNPTEEDGVFGKYTPFGALTYNVRSDIAQGLEVGKAYYVDITEVPS